MGADKHDPKALTAAPLIRRTKEMTFSSLHHHTTHSYLDGYGTPEAHVKRAAELGIPAIAATEHGNINSHVQLERAALDIGVKPVFGCELYCGGIDEATQRKNHLTVLAENAEGYRNLLRVVSRGWAEGFYYEPTVSGEMLGEHKEGLIVLSGCSGSLLATSITGGKNVAPEDASLERGYAVAKKFKASLGDSYYLEVQAFPELDKTCTANQAIADIGAKLGIPLVATLDVHYTEPGESEMQQILHNTRPGKKRSTEDQARAWSYDVKLCPVDDDAILKRLVHTGLNLRQASQAISNSRAISQRCTVTLPKVDNLRYPLPTGYDDPIMLFRRWINDGWTYRRFPTLSPQERQRYVDRCKYEMQLIESKGFVDYFLVVSDAVKFAKDNGIPVGPARGSAAASLVCYLMRITEVDPMHFPTLLFERFIDANRHDLPDIDLDFDDELRWQVRQYLVDKYGADRVGNIGTFTKYKGKNSLEDVQRSLYPDNWECKAAVDEIKSLIIERSSGDLRAAATIEDTIEMFPQVKALFNRFPGLYKAGLLEGNVKGMSIHAAGLVVANAALTDYCAVYTRKNAAGEQVEVVSLDKYDAEYLNILKIDALGLKTMGMIRHAITAIGMTLEELYAIGLDDRTTIEGFRTGDVVGVFQFDGRAMRSVNQGVIPDTFMEICDINALARPGPLHSGATGEYIDIKHGRAEPVHYHEIVDGITEHTHFQVVYQEQILQVVRLLGGFSWEEAARIRKIISKKRGEQEFNMQRDKFVSGAATHGMEKPDADKVFSMLATAGAYAFNAAHCVSYGMLAYWTMWLKQHHATAFYTASLRKSGGGDKKGKEKQSQLLKDCAKKDIAILPLHLNKCSETWTVDGDAIRPGFTQVAGIGERTAEVILDLRASLPDGRFSGWADVGKARGVGPVAIAKMQAFIEEDDPFKLTLLQEMLDKVREELRAGMPTGPDSPFCLPRPTHTSAEVPYEKTDRDVACTWLGVIRERNLKDLFEMHHSKTGEVLDPGTVRDPHLNEWVVMLGEDDSDVLSITVDRWRYNRFKQDVWDLDLSKDLVLIRGLKKHFQARRALYVTDMFVLTLDDEGEIDDSEQGQGQDDDGTDGGRSG